MRAIIRSAVKLLKINEFKQALEKKCDRLNIKLQYVDEWMTTKMCSQCGFVNNNIGKSRLFFCEHCNDILDRDINSARNIYIKSNI